MDFFSVLDKFVHLIVASLRRFCSAIYFPCLYLKLAIFRFSSASLSYRLDVVFL